MRTALITGITGQDGAYLARHLLTEGYTVFGAYRRTSQLDFWRLRYLDIFSHENLVLVEMDLTDLSSCLSVIANYRPLEIYNLAAQSFVGVSFNQPVATAQVTALGVVNLLECIKAIDCDIKFYQASTSEMFGKVAEIPQTEITKFHPRSPYGVAKLYGHWITVNYCESHQIFGSSGILFNHESPIRGEEFVTRKITKAAAAIATGREQILQLGNLDAERDWGFAGDYVVGMHAMLQQDEPGTFVLATNKKTTVRDFARTAFNTLDIDVVFEGQGIEEIGYDVSSGKPVVEVVDRFFRPAEVDLLIGDYSKARRELGWSPSVSWEGLCEMMTIADLERLRC